MSSTLRELEAERRVVRAAIESLRLTPVMFELGARPHPPRDLYRAYLEQSDVFLGIYASSYGWVAPDMDISGLEDEYRLAKGLPRLIYVKQGGEPVEPGLESLLADIALDGVSYRPFTNPSELDNLVQDDLALLLTERFELSATQQSDAGRGSQGTPVRLMSMIYADIEDSPRIREEQPSVIAEHDRLLRAVVRSHEGRVCPTAGNSLAAVFTSAQVAAKAALAAQLEARALLVDGESVRIRMAVHSGDVEECDGGFAGPALNRCGQLLDAAHGGQVLVSATATQLLGDHLPDRLSLIDLGKHRLRDLSRPQRVFQLGHPDLAAEFPPLRTLGGFSNLPVQITSFVGRAEESAELEELIRDSRLVTIVGAGGCGKSRIAVQIAAEMSDEFPDGLCLVELAPLTDADLVASAVAEALGVQIQPGREVLDALAGFLRSKTLLLLVDNCEHLIDDAAAVVGHLLSHTPGIRVLATSREPLRVRGEAVFVLAPLPVPEVGSDWDGLVSSDGVRLFAERAKAANPRFRLTHENGSVVAGICTRLDGIPLALELAASASRLLTLDQIEERLDDRFRLLTGGARDDVNHHRTLEAAIDWSYGLLTPDQSAVFERLGVFAGAFSVEAAEAVCTDETVSKSNILDAVVELADRSLLEIEETPLGVRYRMLETIRAFAFTRLEMRPGRLHAPLQQRHCRYFLSLAEQVTEGPISADAPPEWQAELDAAGSDLRHALAWATDTDHNQLATDLAGALGWYWHLRRRHAEAIHWLQQIPMDATEVAVESRIRAMRFRAHHLTNTLTGGADDFPMAQKLADEGLSLARQNGDPDLVAASLHQVGLISVLGSDSRALAVLQEGLAVAQEAGNAWRQVMIRNMLAHHYNETGRLDDDIRSIESAQALWNENLSAARQIGDDRTVAMTLGFLSSSARTRDLDEAYRLAEESLAIGRKLDDHAVLNNALVYLGAAAYLKGDLETARAIHLEEADLSWRTLGEDDEMAHMSLGIIDYVQGDLASARGHLARSLTLMNHSPGSMWGVLNLRRVLWGLGRVLAREDSFRDAAILFAAVEAADRAHPPWIDDVQEPDDYQQCVDLIAAALTPDTLKQVQQQGATMTLKQAADYALGLLEVAVTA